MGLFRKLNERGKRVQRVRAARATVAMAFHTGPFDPASILIEDCRRRGFFWDGQESMIDLVARSYQWESEEFRTAASAILAGAPLEDYRIRTPAGIDPFSLYILLAALECCLKNEKGEKSGSGLS